MSRTGITSTLIVLTVLGLGSIARSSFAADGAIKWLTDLSNARQAAAKTKRPIIVFVTAKWCGYCQKMEKTTFTNASVAATLQRCFVPLFIDADENEDLVKRLKVDVFPALLIFSPDGKLIDRTKGFMAPEQAREWLGKSR